MSENADGNGLVTEEAAAAAAAEILHVGAHLLPSPKARDLNTETPELQKQTQQTSTYGRTCLTFQLLVHLRN